VDLRSRLGSAPALAAARYELLEGYFRDHVLGAHGFCCPREHPCRASVKPNLLYGAGQLSHVGRHYELSVAGRPLRILVLGMDTGRPDSGVTMAVRRTQVYDRIPETFSRRNPHMRATTLALRALLGSEDWSLPGGESFEHAGKPIHLLDGYAMANLRLCSAVEPRSTRSRGTPVMGRNCLPHLRATIEILEPTVIVVQGLNVRRDVGSLLRAVESLSKELEVAEFAGVRVVLASFIHPSYPGPKGNWSWPRSPYFVNTVLPTLRRAQDLALQL